MRPWKAVRELANANIQPLLESFIKKSKEKHRVGLIFAQGDRTFPLHDVLRTSLAPIYHSVHFVRGQHSGLAGSVSKRKEWIEMTAAALDAWDRSE